MSNPCTGVERIPFAREIPQHPAINTSSSQSSCTCVASITAKVNVQSPILRQTVRDLEHWPLVSVRSRTLLLARYGEPDACHWKFPRVSQQTLAEMVLLC